MSTLLTVVLFQCAWFASALGAAHAMPLVGPAACALAVAAGMGLQADRRRLLIVAFALAVFGWLAESLMVWWRLLSYPGSSSTLAVAPFWIAMLWAAFATLIGPVFSGLRGRVVLAATLGAITGPLAYHGASQLGALTLHAPVWLGMLMIALMWAIALPGALWLDRAVER